MLYAEICEVFLGKRQQARGVPPELSPAQSVQVLQVLAYQMMLKGVNTISRREALEIIKEPLQLVSQSLQPAHFLQMVENRSGLLLEREHEMYSFAHLTFQEYLAAVATRENGIEQVLISHLEESWWYETIRLYCAQADATTIIAACLQTAHPSISALLLAIECRKEALKIHPSVSNQLDLLLERDIEDADPERQRVAAEALLGKRTVNMREAESGTCKDTSLLTNAEYQVFLDEQKLQGGHYRPDHWRKERFLPGQANAPILGVRPFDVLAFCLWLSDREMQVWYYRPPRRFEYQKEESIDGRSTQAGYWTNEGKTFTWFQMASLSEQAQQENNLLLNPWLDLDHAISEAQALTRHHMLADPDAMLEATRLAHDIAYTYLFEEVDLFTHDLASYLTLMHDLSLARCLVSDLARASELVYLLGRESTIDEAAELARTLSQASTWASDAINPIRVATPMQRFLRAIFGRHFWQRTGDPHTSSPLLAIITQKHVRLAFVRYLTRIRMHCECITAALAKDLFNVLVQMRNEEITDDPLLAHSKVLSLAEAYVRSTALWSALDLIDKTLSAPQARARQPVHHQQRK